MWCIFNCRCILCTRRDTFNELCFTCKRCYAAVYANHDATPAIQAWVTAALQEAAWVNYLEPYQHHVL